MSGIYISGMEMPKTCCYCPLMIYDPDREWFDSMARTGAHICVLTGELIDNTKREDHCPLIPVPDHGDLIDRDALPENRMVFGGVKFINERFIKEAPTIIPASGGTDNE